jgi:hypothetical protein
LPLNPLVKIDLSAISKVAVNLVPAWVVSRLEDLIHGSDDAIAV